MIQRLVYFTVHFLFWAIFIVLSWMSVASSPEELEFMKTHITAPLLLLLWTAISFYSFYFYFQPTYFDTKRYITYFFVSLGSSLVLTSLVVFIFWIKYPLFEVHLVEKFLGGLVGSFIISQCGSLLRGFISWNQNVHYKAELENKSLRNELAMLKSQLSPHFLFNTLNNIDTLIYKSQDDASAMLIRLSELLRYMLYESESKEISITKEIEYIERLTELQQMRFTDQKFIQLIIKNSYPELKIAPLLFLPFIENAFKFVTKPNEMPAIKIDLDIDEGRFRFSCQNHFDSNTEISNSTDGGIGLSNARRRLELLYKDSFDLTISNSKNSFHVELIINVQ